LRRYPGKLEHFAFDLFFEKPVLVVEHQAYFKDGERLAEFIFRLNTLEGLQWSGLHEIMTKSYLEQETSNESTACKLYANHQVISNDDDHERTFVITKSESDEVPVQGVLVNGQATKFRLDGDQLQFAVPIPALSSREVKIVYRNALPNETPRRAFTSRSRVWTRRMLSEFRDNVLCRSNLFLARAQAQKNR
jgi:hypothetical protein